MKLVIQFRRVGGRERLLRAFPEKGHAISKESGCDSFKQQPIRHEEQVFNVVVITNIFRDCRK